MRKLSPLIGAPERIQSPIHTTLRTVDQIASDITKIDQEVTNLKRKREVLIAELRNVSSRALELAQQLA